MRIRTVLAEVALALLLEVLADLGLVIVVWDVKHFVLDLDWKLLNSKYNNSSKTSIFQPQEPIIANGFQIFFSQLAKAGPRGTTPTP